MPVYVVTYESKKEVVVVVEAPNRLAAERCVSEAAESGFLDGEGWEYTDEANADNSGGAAPEYRVNENDELVRVVRQEVNHG